MVNITKSWIDSEYNIFKVIQAFIRKRNYYIIINNETWTNIIIKASINLDENAIYYFIIYFLKIIYIKIAQNLLNHIKERIKRRVVVKLTNGSTASWDA